MSRSFIRNKVKSRHACVKIVTHEEEYISVADTVTKITQHNGKTRVQVQVMAE